MPESSTFDPATHEQELDPFDLLPEAERDARLLAQWRHGPAEPGRVIALERVIAQAGLATPLPELMVLLPGAIERPRALMRAWESAELAVGSLRAFRLLGARVVLVPDRGRWEAALEIGDDAMRTEGTTRRRPERSLRSLERQFRAEVAAEAVRIEEARAAHARSSAEGTGGTTPGPDEPLEDASDGDGTTTEPPAADESQPDRPREDEPEDGSDA